MFSFGRHLKMYAQIPFPESRFNFFYKLGKFSGKRFIICEWVQNMQKSIAFHHETVVYIKNAHLLLVRM